MTGNTTRITVAGTEPAGPAPVHARRRRVRPPAPNEPSSSEHRDKGFDPRAGSPISRRRSDPELCPERPRPNLVSLKDSLQRSECADCSARRIARRGSRLRVPARILLGGYAYEAAAAIVGRAGSWPRLTRIVAFVSTRQRGSSRAHTKARVLLRGNDQARPGGAPKCPCTRCPFRTIHREPAGRARPLAVAPRPGCARRLSSSGRNVGRACHDRQGWPAEP